MARKKELEWIAFRVDFNSKEVEKINVLKDFNERIYKEFRKGNLKSLEELRNLLEKMLRSEYWCRCEHEMLVRGMHSDTETKLDVFFQLQMNMARIAEYVNYTMQLNLR